MVFVGVVRNKARDQPYGSVVFVFTLASSVMT